ncbi:MAG: DUF4337 domain-containing protein [Alphaproteobacteria bacterium]|nr:DUF4337 domain-containing protein [Alphaproteobacteria bacterium]
MSTHHTHEQLHEATHHAAGHGDHGHGSDSGDGVKSFAKRVAIQISVMAALLAFAEMGGKNAQNDALIKNQEAANLWAFFQAKTIRMTTMATAGETIEALLAGAVPAENRRKAEAQIAKWKATAARYQSEPETGEGRKELAERAKAAEKKRDNSLSAYHQFEYGSAAFQLGIVLASAAVVTGVAMLAHISLGLGAVGLVFTALGAFAPNLVHF